ncbi:AEC family transporter [Pseudokineococcus marinus]|uniref:AEC family transporter n=1 Tax=Pseudokineococcus marinus TaxID=351215 RepID=A0A849BMN2_9ACTN|nr:AEC family transporter [Pseudokineococcus marinus]NNH22635.1 AEC family transporter [Pseudokineococcus marinus]
MQGVVDGFATILLVIAVGALVAHLRVVDEGGQRVLSRVAFTVANPALMVVVLAEADISRLFTGYVAAIAAGVLVTATTYACLARWVLRRDLTGGVVGVLCTGYVNAGNLGLPVAAYVLGDAALMAPVLLLQMLVLQPLALALLDRASADRRPSVLRLLTTPLRNPITVGALVGLALNLTGLRLPVALDAPLGLVADMAVPTMLLAFGVSLRLGPLPGRGTSAPELAVVTALKTLVQPGVALLVAGPVLGLPPGDVLAAAVISALPTAQNVFVVAARYDTGRALLTARDAISTTTLVSVPVMVGLSALLG